jgi:hypothetical protein
MIQKLQKAYGSLFLSISIVRDESLLRGFPQVLRHCALLNQVQQIARIDGEAVLGGCCKAFPLAALMVSALE